jgi:hypothetical protein
MALVIEADIRNSKGRRKISIENVGSNKAEKLQPFEALDEM